MSRRLAFILVALALLLGLALRRAAVSRSGVASTPVAAVPDEALVPGRHQTPPAAAVTVAVPEPARARQEQVLRLVRELEQSLSMDEDAPRERALDVLLPELAALDPAAAATVAENWENDGLRPELVQRVAGQWAGMDPAGAMEWVAQLPDPDERQRAALALGGRLAEGDPADALRVVELLGVAPETAAFGALLQRWAAQAPTAAAAWVRNRPPGPDRDALVMRVALEQARVDPIGAAGFVQAEASPGVAREDALGAVLQQWQQRDPAAAAAWAAALPPGPLRQRALAELAPPEATDAAAIAE